MIKLPASPNQGMAGMLLRIAYLLAYFLPAASFHCFRNARRLV